MIPGTFCSGDKDDKVVRQAEDAWQQAVAGLQTRFYLLTEIIEKLEERTSTNLSNASVNIVQLTQLQQSVLNTMTALRSELTVPHNEVSLSTNFQIENHTAILQALIQQVDDELTYVSSVMQ